MSTYTEIALGLERLAEHLSADHLRGVQHLMRSLVVLHVNANLLEIAVKFKMIEFNVLELKRYRKCTVAKIPQKSTHSSIDYLNLSRKKKKIKYANQFL